MKITDLKNMPNFNPEVKNGIDSVSTGRVALMPYLDGIHFLPNTLQAKTFGKEMKYSVFCIKHGACNKVTPEGIWRCLACNEGCWEVKE